MRPIPKNAEKIQPGLYAAINSFKVRDTTHVFYDLYSEEGYCFYEVSQPENYDENGNLLPENQRVYAQYARTAYTMLRNLKENFVSIPVQEGFQIV